MKVLKVFAVATLVFCGCKQQETPKDVPTLLSQGKWIDLTYSFSNQTLYWPSDSSHFHLDTVFNGTTAGGYFYSSNNYKAGEHGGTHLDAPVHFAEGKLSADAIPLSQLTGEAIVIDVTAKAAANRDYEISVEDVENWEKQHGKIPDGAIVLFRTGFGQFYPDAEKYLGTAEKGPQAIANLHFPGIAPALSEWLVKNRNIKAVGLDTASVDFGQSKAFKTHQILYAENICGFENVANLDQLPATGAFVVALPMKIKDGSGAPLRIVAWTK
jgi:kynurenine formamidase